MFFLDLTGGVKPYLLTEMDNHIGALTRVEYAPSTRFYLEDEKRPETRWKTPLPFPVQVVARVEVIDEISGGKLTTEYRYHHGYWDGAEREFRGFGRVEQLDTEIFEDYNAEACMPGARSSPCRPPFSRRRSRPAPGSIRAPSATNRRVGGADYSAEYWPGDPQALERRRRA